MDQPVLVHSDVHKGAEARHVGHHAFQHHAGFDVRDLAHLLVKAGRHKLVARVAARPPQFVQNVIQRIGASLQAVAGNFFQQRRVGNQLPHGGAPRLRALLVEANIGWIPAMLEQTDDMFLRYRWFTGTTAPLPTMPSRVIIRLSLSPRSRRNASTRSRWTGSSRPCAIKKSTSSIAEAPLLRQLRSHRAPRRDTPVWVGGVIRGDRAVKPVGRTVERLDLRVVGVAERLHRRDDRFERHRLLLGAAVIEIGAAGARGDHVEKVAHLLVKSGTVKVDKAREILGFSPKVELEDGLMRNIEWVKQNVDELRKQVAARRREYVV